MTVAKTDTERAKLFKVWQQKQSVEYVAKTCRVSHVTARKYRKLDKWDSRLSKIREAAIVEADDAAKKRLTDNLKLIQVAKQAYAASLLGKAKVVCPKCAANFTTAVPKLKPNFRDIDAVVRLEEFLLQGREALDKPKAVRLPLDATKIKKK